MENTAMNSFERIEWVDLIKGYAIFLVVIGHVLIYMFHEEGGASLVLYTRFICLFLCSWEDMLLR